MNTKFWLANTLKEHDVAPFDDHLRANLRAKCGVTQSLFEFSFCKLMPVNVPYYKFSDMLVMEFSFFLVKNLAKIMGLELSSFVLTTLRHHRKDITTIVQ